MRRLSGRVHSQECEVLVHVSHLSVLSDLQLSNKSSNNVLKTAGHSSFYQMFLVELHLVLLLFPAAGWWSRCRLSSWSRTRLSLSLLQPPGLAAVADCAGLYSQETLKDQFTRKCTQVQSLKLWVELEAGSCCDPIFHFRATRQWFNLSSLDAGRSDHTKWMWGTEGKHVNPVIISSLHADATSGEVHKTFLEQNRVAAFCWTTEGAGDLI